jgi:hypothetical protein
VLMSCVGSARACASCLACLAGVIVSLRSFCPQIFWSPCVCLLLVARRSVLRVGGGASRGVDLSRALSRDRPRSELIQTRFGARGKGIDPKRARHIQPEHHPRQKTMRRETFRLIQ